MNPEALSYAPQARRDLDLILDQLLKAAGPLVADDYAIAFETAFLRLGQFPLLGMKVPELGDSIRRWVVSPYIIIYTVDALGLTVLRVVHGRRKITPELLDD